MNTQKCISCNEEVVDGKFCKTHHIAHKKAEWLDNTDIDNLGIVKWCHEMMPEFAYNKSPKFHIELFYDLLRLYNPEYINKYERLYEWIGFREAAKSTLETLVTSYILAHNGETIKITINGEVKEFLIEERTIVIISQTAGSAEEFTVRIRDAFTESERLRYYYEVSIQEGIDSLTGQWTRNAFKLNSCFVIGIGSGQMIRGKVKGASRPTLVFADDIYSESNVVTEESRNKIKRWWNNAVMNSIDNLKGKVVVLGTIVHEDTVIVELEKNPLWKTKKVPVMGHVDENNTVIMDSFHEFISKYTKVDWDMSVCVLPHDDIEDREERIKKQRTFFQEIQDEKDWELQWPERINLYFVATKYKEAVYNQTVAGFYQEYFHQIQAPSDKRFKREFFQEVPTWELKLEHGFNWIKLPGEDWQTTNIEFGVDLAGTGIDAAVISVVATLHDLRCYVLYQAIGKWSLRDDLRGDTARDLRRLKVTLNRDSIVKVGVVDEIFRLSRRFRPTVIKVGVAGEEEIVVQEIRRVFQENYDYTTYIMSRPQTKREGAKEQRIMNTLLPYYETRMVYHNPGLTQLEYQLEYLGRTKHDDCADSLECAFFSLSFPEKINSDILKNKEVQNDIPPHLRAQQANYNLYDNWREYI